MGGMACMGGGSAGRQAAALPPSGAVMRVYDNNALQPAPGGSTNRRPHMQDAAALGPAYVARLTIIVHAYDNRAGAWRPDGALPNASAA